MIAPPTLAPPDRKNEQATAAPHPSPPPPPAAPGRSGPAGRHGPADGASAAIASLPSWLRRVRAAGVTRGCWVLRKCSALALIELIADRQWYRPSHSASSITYRETAAISLSVRRGPNVHLPFGVHISPLAFALAEADDTCVMRGGTRRCSRSGRESVFPPHHYVASAGVTSHAFVWNKIVPPCSAAETGNFIALLTITAATQRDAMAVTRCRVV